jgi:hypothetical protein
MTIMEGKGNAIGYHKRPIQSKDSDKIGQGKDRPS